MAILQNCLRFVRGNAKQRNRINRKKYAADKINVRTEKVKKKGGKPYYLSTVVSFLSSYCFFFQSLKLSISLQGMDNHHLLANQGRNPVCFYKRRSILLFLLAGEFWHCFFFYLSLLIKKRKNIFFPSYFFSSVGFILIGRIIHQAALSSRIRIRPHSINPVGSGGFLPPASLFSLISPGCCTTRTDREKGRDTFENNSFFPRLTVLPLILFLVWLLCCFFLSRKHKTSESRRWFGCQSVTNSVGKVIHFPDCINVWKLPALCLPVDRLTEIYIGNGVVAIRMVIGRSTSIQSHLEIDWRLGRKSRQTSIWTANFCATLSFSFFTTQRFTHLRFKFPALDKNFLHLSHCG